MTQHLFIITSAINTRFGAFNKQERLIQTLDTIKSVFSKVPTAKICIFESSGVPLSTEIIDILKQSAHWVIDMSNDSVLHSIQEQTDNWDVVKNLSEMIAFKSGLNMLEANNLLEGIDRIHKMSGRYVLTDDFNLSLYDSVTDKIVVAEKRTSQFVDMDVPYQYMSRLWSWPKMHHEIVKQFYADATTEFLRRLEEGKYIDIEHLLYHLLPKEHVTEINPVGVAGLLGQTRQLKIKFGHTYETRYPIRIAQSKDLSYNLCTL